MIFQKIQLDTIDSTNAYLRRVICGSSDPKPTVVISNKQTAGRGRLGRSWHSPNGGIYLSACIFPKCSSKKLSGFTLIVGALVLCTLHELGYSQARIKWPNDIYAKGKKLGGILCENVGGSIILGIGINVDGEIPTDLKSKASCLEEVQPIGIRKDQIITSLINKMEEEFKITGLIEEEGNPSYEMSECDALFDIFFAEKLEYLRQNSVTIGQMVTVSKRYADSRGSVFLAEALDIDDSGQLLVRVAETGQVVSLNSGEVTLSEGSKEII